MQFLPAWLNQQRNSAKVAATESSLHVSSGIRTTFPNKRFAAPHNLCDPRTSGIFASSISGLESTSPPGQCI
jgi:hypothetical protein